MSQNGISVIVGGFPEMAELLQRTNRFEQIFDVPGTGDFQRQAAAGQYPAKENLVLVFADNTIEDGPSIELIVSRLAGSGYPVLLLNTTGRAQEITASHKNIAMLNGGATVNQVLAAVSSITPFMLDPVMDGHDEVYQGMELPAPTQVQLQPIILDDDPVEVVEKRTKHKSRPAADAWVPGGAGHLADIGVTDLDSTSSPFDGADDDFAAVDAVLTPVASPLSPQPAPFAETTTPVDDLPGGAGGWAAPNAAASEPPVAQPIADPWQTGTPTAPAGQPPVSAEPVSPFQSPPVMPATPQDFATPTAPPVPPSTPPVAPPAPVAAPAGWDTPPTPVNTSIAPPAPANAPAPRASIQVPQGVVGADSTQTHASSKAQVITIAASKGGTGKSSVALNIAAFLGLRTNQSVAIIDLNIQQADVGKYIGDYASKTVVELVSNLGTVTPENIRDYMAYSREGSFYAVLGPHNPQHADPGVLNSRVYKAILENLRRTFDYIIIDTPVAERYHDLVTSFAMPEADKIIFVVAPNWTTVHNARLYLDLMTKEVSGPRLKLDSIGWILNQYRDDVDCDEDQVRDAMAQYRYLGHLPYTIEWQRANNNFELVVTQRYEDINNAFSKMLHSVTGVDFPVRPESTNKRGWFDRLRNR